jgi:hypothetical protein
MPNHVYSLRIWLLEADNGSYYLPMPRDRFERSRIVRGRIAHGEANTYEPVTRLASTHVHLVNRSTGETLDEDSGA